MDKYQSPRGILLILSREKFFRYFSEGIFFQLFNMDYLNYNTEYNFFFYLTLDFIWEKIKAEMLGGLFSCKRK